MSPESICYFVSTKIEAMKLVLISVIAFAASISFAQKVKESEVPAAVKQAFKQKFTAVKSVRWSKESENEFEAEFKINGVEHSSNFDNAGKWLVTETEVKTKDLPVAVIAVLKKDFIDFKIEEAEKVENAANELFYELALEKGESNIELKISPEGIIISKEEKKETED